MTFNNINSEAVKKLKAHGVTEKDTLPVAILKMVGYNPLAHDPDKLGCAGSAAMMAGCASYGDLDFYGRIEVLTNDEVINECARYIAKHTGQKVRKTYSTGNGGQLQRTLMRAVNTPNLPLNVAEVLVMTSFYMGQQMDPQEMPDDFQTGVARAIATTNLLKSHTGVTVQ
jgi:hypothetical protein